MKNMVNHADELDNVAIWFGRLTLATVVIVILGVITQIFFSPNPDALNSTLDSSTLQFLKFINILAIIVGGGLTAFLLHVGDVICRFLADFARGLLLQQIKQDRQNQQTP